MAERSRYSPIQIGLHWLVAILVLATWWNSDGMNRALDHRLEQGADGTWPLHVWLGLSVLGAVAIRAVVRLLEGAPEPVDHGSELLARAAWWSHALLYALLLLIPLGGILVWFLGVESLGEIHGLAGTAILWVAGAHAAAALYHHFVLKDRTLVRMLKPGA